VIQEERAQDKIKDLPQVIQITDHQVKEDLLQVSQELHKDKDPAAHLQDTLQIDHLDKEDLHQAILEPKELDQPVQVEMLHLLEIFSEIQILLDVEHEHTDIIKSLKAICTFNKTIFEKIQRSSI